MNLNRHKKINQNYFKHKITKLILLITATLLILPLFFDLSSASANTESNIPIIIKYRKESKGKFLKRNIKIKDLKRIKNDPEVEYAEVDELQTPQVESVSYQENAVNAPLSWQKMSSVSTKVIVAVCDSGVESTHPDLQENLRKDLGYDVYNMTKLGWDKVISPHGTMVSGVIAASANNNIGTRGVAVKVEIMPLKMTFDSTGNAYLSTMANCIKYGADNGAKVVNVSYSGLATSVIQDAASYAMSKNVNVVFSLGNSNTFLTSRNNTNVIGVGATDANNNKAVFSNTGRPVDVVAPGLGIYTTTIGGGYATVSGTSFSSPIAAGIIAMGRAKNPSLSALNVVNSLGNYTDDLGEVGYDTMYGFGIINANKLVQ
jgi:thermitase